jgi:trimeric autotransporter adhesin
MDRSDGFGRTIKSSIYWSDNDSFVNSFTVRFSENLYVASVQETDFTVEGYTVTGVSVSGDTVTLTVTEKTTIDLNATPKVTLVGTVEDLARNARTTQAALTAIAVQVAINTADVQSVATEKAALTLTADATDNVVLPVASNGVTITWTKNGVAASGTVAVATSDVLVATLTKGAATDTKSFTVTGTTGTLTVQ